MLRKELPILTLVTLLTAGLLFDFTLSRFDAVILLFVFGLLMTWSLYQGFKQPTNQPVDTFAKEVETQLSSRGVTRNMTIQQAVFWVVIGLLLLIASSRILVWGAVELAQLFGVSDMVIGLTIVAAGTSLPELASSVMAARKGEHDIALGNVIGSNLFNTLAVVGIAGIISPLSAGPDILFREMVVMAALTVLLFLIGYGFRGHQGRINRVEGAALLLAYVGYTVWLSLSV